MKYCYILMRNCINSSGKIFVLYLDLESVLSKYKEMEDFEDLEI